MKKLSLTVLMCFIILTVQVSAFFDIEPNTKLSEAVLRMQLGGYIQGFEDGNFRPDAGLTRAEFVTIINKMYGYREPDENKFTDINEEDWYYSAVLCGVRAGYIQGYSDGMFGPDDMVTREQVCVMLNRILNVELIPYGGKITDGVSDWAKDSVEKLVSNRLFTLEDGGRFRGTQAITRGEVCIVLEKCIVEVPIEFEPINLENLVREELEKRLAEIIKVIETKVLPGCTYEKNKEVSERIVESMKKYLKDPDYDYVKDAQETYAIYRTLGSVKAGELKGLIFNNAKTEDLSIIFEFFYTPDIKR